MNEPGFPARFQARDVSLAKKCVLRVQRHDELPRYVVTIPFAFAKNSQRGRLGQRRIPDRGPLVGLLHRRRTCRGWSGWSACG